VSDRKRIQSIDIVRGVVMIFMALDHVRDWVTNQRFRPEDLSKSTPALFATRWITHFCAPTFFLLAGVGVGILYLRGKTADSLSRFLLIRGVWLLILELIITPVGWQFGFEFIPAFALVLWALGWSMLLLALLIHLPRPLVAVFCGALIFGHNLLDPIKPAALGRFAGLWNLLHVPGFIIPNKLFVGYPLIPWVAVMATGFLLATVYAWEPQRRQRFLIQAGGAAVLLFIALRALNGYGNPGPWAAQRSSALTVASFLNTQKYPPSLDYLLMTLGPALIALALAERVHGRIADWVAVYGRVPLFFYVVHIFVAHALAVVLAYVQGGELRRIQVVNHPDLIPAWYGVPLVGVYAAWAVVVLLLYFPCRRFARLKNTRSDWWLSYF
jgi:uncharacterized membrane protein